LLLPPFVTLEQDPARRYEKERDGDDPEAETDDGAVIRVWVGMLGCRGLGRPARGRMRVDGDSGLDGGGERIWWLG
jgi:hypothetical protein